MTAPLTFYHSPHTRSSGVRMLLEEAVAAPVFLAYAERVRAHRAYRRAGEADDALAAAQKAEAG